MSLQNSQIGSGQRVLGDIAGDGNLDILGRLEGAVHIGGTLTVGPDALVLADIVAATVRIDGRVEGRVRVAGEVTIGARGCLVGEVEGLLEVEEGGVFQGRLVNTVVASRTGDALSSVPPKVEDEALLDDDEERSDDSQRLERSPRPIRRLTSEDTLPPPPPIVPTPKDESVTNRSQGQTGTNVKSESSEIPITRKQKIRTDTQSNGRPKPQVRGSRRKSKRDLQDPWFEDQDYLLDSK